MGHLIVLLVLSAALLGSGVLHALLKIGPSAERAGTRRGVAGLRGRRGGGASRRRPLGPRPSPTPRSPAPAPSAQPRRAPASAAAADAAQIHKLARRLSRVESALAIRAAGEVDLDGRREEDLRGRVLERARSGYAAEQIAGEAGLSRGEVELMLKMNDGRR